MKLSLENKIMNESLIWGLVVWAVNLSGYPMPDEMPTLRYASHDFFVNEACYGIDDYEDPCTVRAMYQDSNRGVILLNRRYFSKEGRFSPYHKGILVHEITHYLQDLSGKWTGYHRLMNTNPYEYCVKRTEREKEAEYIQNKYMQEEYSVRRIPKKHKPCKHTVN